MHEIPQLDAKGLRHFALTTAGIIVGLFGVVLPWVVGFAWPLWPWVLAAVLAMWGLIKPASLRPVYRGWMRFGQLASSVMTPLVLGTVFFVVILPMGVVMRLAGYDPMHRRLDPDTASYRIPSQPVPRDSVERPF